MLMLNNVMSSNKCIDVFSKQTDEFSFLYFCKIATNFDLFDAFIIFVIHYSDLFWIRLIVTFELSELLNQVFGYHDLLIVVLKFLRIYPILFIQLVTWHDIDRFENIFIKIIDIYC